MRADRQLHTEFMADSRAVRDTLIALRLVPPLACLGRDDRAMAELVLAEVLNNVVEHAYGGQAGRIALRLRRQPAGLAFCVVDDGCAMPDGPLSSRTAPTVGPDGDLPQGGFGLPLIRALAHALRYRRHRGYNVLSVTLRVDSAAGMGRIVSDL